MKTPIMTNTDDIFSCSPFQLVLFVNGLGRLHILILYMLSKIGSKYCTHVCISDEPTR